ncbi:MAG: hypothetical protein Q8O88_03630 [bacterium]|nr:hypothetical protein [bacterium]
MELIEKLIRGQKVSKSEIASELYEICERVHSSCGSQCPVFKLNGGEVPNTQPFEQNRGCDCFKNGKAMYDFIKKSKPQD